MRLLLVGPVLALQLAASGCGGGCTSQAVWGLAVYVAYDGTPVCDATVAAQDGGYSETLIRFGGTNDCLYLGAAERAGTYLVTATRGSLMATATATVRADECHVEREQVFIDLHD